MSSSQTFVRALLCCAGLLSWAGAAWAGKFQVLPVTVQLGAQAPTETLTVRNSSAEPVRLQVTAHAWQESEAGAMQLGPTSDLVFYPSMLEIGPGEERKIRVGSAVAAAGIERSYRLFVEEMPPIASSPTDGGKVRVLVRMGIPVFVVPPKAAMPGPEIVNMHVEKGRLSFDVRNQGNAHVKARSVRIVGRDAAGRQRFESTQPAWYLLAGGRRHYDVVVPEGACRVLGTVDATLEAEGTGASVRVPVAPAGCRP